MHSLCNFRSRVGERRLVQLFKDTIKHGTVGYVYIRELTRLLWPETVGIIADQIKNEQTGMNITACMVVQAVV